MKKRDFFHHQKEMPEHTLENTISVHRFQRLRHCQDKKSKDGTSAHPSEREKYRVGTHHVLELPLVPSFTRTCRNGIEGESLTGAFAIKFIYYY